MQASPIPRPRTVPRSASPGMIDLFDVFVAYHSADLHTVLDICAELRGHGIRPWIDVEQIRPGTWAQEAIRTTRTAAVFLGAGGTGRWQRLEIRAFVERCANEGIPLVPVLLPGLTELPSELVLLRQLNFVQFKDSVHDPAALTRLRWGITGNAP